MWLVFYLPRAQCQGLKPQFFLKALDITAPGAVLTFAIEQTVLKMGRSFTESFSVSNAHSLLKNIFNLECCLLIFKDFKSSEQEN